MRFSLMPYFCLAERHSFCTYLAGPLYQAFLLPLFEVGVVIPTCKVATGRVIADVCGRIDYVQPGGASLAHFCPRLRQQSRVNWRGSQESNRYVAAGGTVMAWHQGQAYGKIYGIGYRARAVRLP